MEKLVTKKQLQELLDVSLASINKYLEQGMPVAVQGGNGGGDVSKFNLDDVKAWLNTNSKTKNEELLAVRLRKLTAEAETAEIKLGLLRGQIIRTEDAAAIFGNECAVMRQNVIGIGPRHCYAIAALGSDPVAICELIQRASAEALESLRVDELYAIPIPKLQPKKKARASKKEDSE